VIAPVVDTVAPVVDPIGTITAPVVETVGGVAPPVVDTLDTPAAPLVDSGEAAAPTVMDPVETVPGSHSNGGGSAPASAHPPVVTQPGATSSVRPADSIGDGTVPFEAAPTAAATVTPAPAPSVAPLEPTTSVQLGPSRARRGGVGTPEAAPAGTAYATFAALLPGAPPVDASLLTSLTDGSSSTGLAADARRLAAGLGTPLAGSPAGSGGGGGFSPFFIGLLIALASIARPLYERLRLPSFSWRPAVFVSLLERPG
jgi:hypothetical protein